MADVKNLLARARAFLVQCGNCDAGLAMNCTCPPGDPRSVILDLVRELERLTQGSRRTMKTVIYHDPDSDHWEGELPLLSIGLDIELPNGRSATIKTVGVCLDDEEPYQVATTV